MYAGFGTTLGKLSPVNCFTYIRTQMIRNFFVIAWRTLVKKQLYAFINIGGLALGLASMLLIVVVVSYELSYDRFHEGASDVYRVAWFSDVPQTRTPHPMAQAMVEDFPEVEHAVSLTPLWGAGLTRRTFSFRNPDSDVRHDEKGVLAVDSTFFKVFSFPLLKGDPDKVLSTVEGVLLSESAARRHFGDADPMGKLLMVNNEEHPLQVVGVFADVPENSHFHFDFLISYVRSKHLEDGDSEYFTWNDFGHFNYVRLKPGTDPKQLEAKLLDWVGKHISVSSERIDALKQNHYGFRLQRITDIHLHSHIKWELEANGNIEYIYLMMGAAVFLLIVASLNVMNLTTAAATERAREIGVRKTLGAQRLQLAVQFIAESCLSVFAAAAIALLLVDLLLPVINAFTGYHFAMADLLSQGMLYWLAGLAILIGVAAGTYPAFYMSAVKPMQVLKGKFSRSRQGYRVRQGLIVFQFFAAMILISGSMIIYYQMFFIRHKNLGFSKEEVLVLPVKDYHMLYHLPSLHEQLMHVPGVMAVSGASNIPGQSFNSNGVYLPGAPQNEITTSEVFVGYDLGKVLGLTMADGRFFEWGNPVDSGNVFVINETLARNLQLEHAVGEEIVWARDGEPVRGTVIGVVKDFNFQSLHLPVGPLIMRLRPYYNQVVIRIKPDHFEDQIAAIKKAWQQADNMFTFEFNFLDEQLDKQYAVEQKMATVIGGFSVLAVVIACFGLFGLAALDFQQRLKEVSVRKVLGAPLWSLMTMLIRNFTRLVIIAVAIGAPVAWYLMDRWLENFTFRISLNPLWFVLAGVFLVVLSWATIGYLTIKTSSVNPVETLRND